MDERTDPSDRDARTARHWGRMAEEQERDRAARAAVGWLDSPLVQREHINPKISGLAHVGWFEWALSEFVAKDARAAANIGCGAGGLERHARFLGFPARFDSFDLSEEALEVARNAAAREGLTGIEYQQADLNVLDLGKNKYQVVFASMSLHHVRDLERLMENIRAALTPGGRFIFNEYVGPARFQWTDLQLELINRLLAGFPERICRDVQRPKRIKRREARPDPAQLAAADPSEAIRSDEILPLAGRSFTCLARRDYGGTLLHMLLNYIVGNFREDRPEDVALLRKVSSLESLLIETGVLESDFTVAVYGN